MNKIEAPVEVRKAIDELAAAHPEREKWDLARWIWNWSLLADEIGNYAGSLSYEYFNDLHVRDEIHDVLKLAHDARSIAILEWAIPLVDATDRLFWSKSAPDDEGLMWGLYLQPHAWWMRRLPLDEALVADLRLAGHRRTSTRYFQR